MTKETNNEKFPFRSVPFLATIATAFFLTACSSSSDSNHPNPHGSNAFKDNKVLVRDGNKPLNQTTGYYFGIENEDSNQEQLVNGKTSATPQFSLNKIIIDKQTIDLLPAPVPHANNGFVNYEDATIGTHLQHARYGSLGQAPGLANGNSYLFTHGEISTSVPDVGNVAYHGKVLGLAAQANKESDGNARFNVDFAKKSVNGTLTFTKHLPEMEVSATINGSHFSGNAGGVNTQGAFYGDNGAELAGIFRKVNAKGEVTHGGAFGASKQ